MCLLHQPKSLTPPGSQTCPIPGISSRSSSASQKMAPKSGRQTYANERLNENLNVILCLKKNPWRIDFPIDIIHQMANNMSDSFNKYMEWKRIEAIDEWYSTPRGCRAMGSSARHHLSFHQAAGQPATPIHFKLNERWCLLIIYQLFHFHCSLLWWIVVLKEA